MTLPEYGRPQERCWQECTKPDLQKKSPVLSDPLQDIAGEGRQEPLAHYLQIGSHDLIGERWDLQETKFIQDFSLADATPFSRFSFFQPDFLQNQNLLINHICPSSLPCIPFSSCELTS